MNTVGSRKMKHESASKNVEIAGTRTSASISPLIKSMGEENVEHLRVRSNSNSGRMRKISLYAEHFGTPEAAAISLEVSGTDDGNIATKIPESDVEKMLRVVLAGGEARMDRGKHTPRHRIIFESFFDLTPERLGHIFESFDKDRDGKISYKALKRGLEQWANVPEIEDELFAVLVSKVDSDRQLGTADISLSEFSRAVRMLFMSYLFDPQISGDSKGLPMDIIDYSPLEVSRLNLSREDEIRNFFSGKRDPKFSRRWIDIKSDSNDRLSESLTLKRLAVKYVLHPLSLEDAMESAYEQRAKVDFYSNHFFISAPVYRVVVGPPKTRDTTADGSGTLSQRRSSRRSVPRVKVDYISMFLSYPAFDTLITFHRLEEEGGEEDGGTSSGEEVINLPGLPPAKRWSRIVGVQLEKSYSKLRQYDVQYLAYSILDALVARVAPIVRMYRKLINAERDRMVSLGAMDIFFVDDLKDQIEKMQRSLRTLMRLFKHIIEDSRICDGVTIYLRDVRDDLLQADEDFAEIAAKCDTLLADFEKVSQAAMDRTVYTLTVVTSIFLPAQFLTGVFGMNFRNMPELDWEYSYLVFWVGCVLVTILLLFYFRCGRIDAGFARNGKLAISRRSSVDRRRSRRGEEFSPRL